MARGRFSTMFALNLKPPLPCAERLQKHVCDAILHSVFDYYITCMCLMPRMVTAKTPSCLRVHDI